MDFAEAGISASLNRRHNGTTDNPYDAAVARRIRVRGDQRENPDLQRLAHALLEAARERQPAAEDKPAQESKLRRIDHDHDPGARTRQTNTFVPILIEPTDCTYRSQACIGCYPQACIGCYPHSRRPQPLRCYCSGDRQYYRRVCNGAGEKAAGL